MSELCRQSTEVLPSSLTKLISGHLTHRSEGRWLFLVKPQTVQVHPDNEGLTRKPLWAPPHIMWQVNSRGRALHGRSQSGAGSWGSGMQTGMVGTLYLCSTASVASAGLWKTGGGGRCQLGPRGPLVRNTRGLCDSWASSQGFPGGTRGKESSCQCRRHSGLSFHSWVGKICWRRKWQPTPVFLPGEFCGQRSLAGYSLQGHKEL